MKNFFVKYGAIAISVFSVAVVVLLALLIAREDNAISPGSFLLQEERPIGLELSAGQSFLGSELSTEAKEVVKGAMLDTAENHIASDAENQDFVITRIENKNRNSEKEYPEIYKLVSKKYTRNSILSIERLPTDRGEFYAIEFGKIAANIDPAEYRMENEYTDFVGIFKKTSSGVVLVNPPEGYSDEYGFGTGGNSNYEFLFSKGKFSGLYIYISISGAGVALDFDVVLYSNGMFTLYPMTRRDFPKGYEYEGYNRVDITNEGGDSILSHTTPGYSSNAARCCPDLPSATISWKIVDGKLRYQNTIFEKDPEEEERKADLKKQRTEKPTIESSVKTSLKIHSRTVYIGNPSVPESRYAGEFYLDMGGKLEPVYITESGKKRIAEMYYFGDEGDIYTKKYVPKLWSMVEYTEKYTEVGQGQSNAICGYKLFEWDDASQSFLFNESRSREKETKENCNSPVVKIIKETELPFDGTYFSNLVYREWFEEEE